ncbi:hypothetical protein GH714_000346 [Hevea brasiliensis]|uniref:Uncharacterized protein n=1 Tax=Hevea brasiliensis TaxID=3981 RepID=A0A6A6L594_HEVBR|nr:hypothetical protein GH714_000346 [Hevea brasiliensis]
MLALKIGQPIFARESAPRFNVQSFPELLVDSTMDNIGLPSAGQLEKSLKAVIPIRAIATVNIRNEEGVRWRALTEENARDSFENLLFSVCRFRELTGTYPKNITVVSYNFKKERFSHLHRSAIGFPDSRFFYYGTPTTSTSKEAALKGEALVRAQFPEDPYGCRGTLRRKKLGRDPFHRSIPYPNGCPEIEGLFRYCGAGPYPGSLPWTK